MRIYPTILPSRFRRDGPRKSPPFRLRCPPAGREARGVRRLRRNCAPRTPALRRTVMGIDFPSPFGLAAGFDKEGAGIAALADLGFGHVEVGTITGAAQPGNEKPRLFRLVEDRAVINRMGFNNDGAARRGPAHPRRPAALAAPLRRRTARSSASTSARPRSLSWRTPLTTTWSAPANWPPHADYLVVNVSSPNTPGLRLLQGVETLRPLLTRRGHRSRPGRRTPRAAAGEDRPGPD